MSFRAKVLAFAMLAVVAWQGVAVSEQTEVITLKWAQEQAYENSAERMRLDMEMREVEIDIAELLKDPNLHLEWNRGQLLLLIAKNQQKSNLERSYETTERAVRNQVADAYSALLLAERQLETQRAAIAVLVEKHLVEVEKVKLGLSTELTARALALAVRRAELDLSRAEDGFKRMQMQFNALIGRDLWLEVVLEELETHSEEFSPAAIDFPISLSLALAAENGEAGAMRKAYEEAKYDYRQLYNPDADTFGEGAKLDFVRQARMRYEQAAIAYERFVRDFTIRHWGNYRELLALEQAVHIGLEDLELERQKLEIEEYKAEVGLASMEQVVEQFNKTVQKELSYNSQVESYNRALRSFIMTERGE